MDEKLTTAEVAQALRVHPSTISRMVDQGRLEVAIKLPGIRGAFLFDPSEVERIKEAS